MSKIIPFAAAFILVLAVGFYFFTSKISTTPRSTVQTTGAPDVIEQGISENETPAAEADQIDLSITAPENNVVVQSPSLTVKGVTVPRAEVLVNETDVIANASGNFSTQISLEEGENIIIIVAIDQEGNVAEEEVVVTYTPTED